MSAIESETWESHIEETRPQTIGMYVEGDYGIDKKIEYYQAQVPCIALNGNTDIFLKQLGASYNEDPKNTPNFIACALKSKDTPEFLGHFDPYAQAYFMQRGYAASSPSDFFSPVVDYQIRESIRGERIHEFTVCVPRLISRIEEVEGEG